MATDFLGQTLNIGDDVIFLNYNRTSADLERGKITKLFPHAAEIGMKRRAEYKIVKILTDVAPVVHGRWVHSRYNDCSEQFELVKCSQCNHEAYAMAFYVHGGNYCPNCGAKMDGGDSNASL